MLNTKRTSCLLVFMCALLYSLSMHAAYAQTGTLRIIPISIPYNSVAEVTVVYDNTTASSAFQFVINLPEGFTYSTGSAVLQSNRKADHQLSVNAQGGKLSFIGYSTSGSDLKGAEGALVKFNIKAPSQPGNYAFQLSEVEFSTKAGAKVDVNPQTASVTVLAPQLSTSGEMNFGRVPLGEKRENQITVYNTGNQDLVISSISVDDTRFKVNASLPITIPIGSPGTSLPISFESSVKGELVQKLTLFSNSSTNPVKTVALTASPFAVNEMRVANVMSQNMEEATVSVSLNNMEAAAAFGFSMPLTEEMEYIAGSAVLSERQNGHTVSANVKNNILTLVAFSHQNNAFKLKDGEIVRFKIRTTGQGDVPLVLQHAEISDLTGSNILSAAYNGTLTIQSPHLSLNKSAIDFGNVSVLNSGISNVTIYNTGQANLVLTGIGLPSTYFSHDLTFPFTITPGSSREAAFTFSGAPAGVHEVQAKLYHSDKNRNPTDIHLKAVAFEPNELSISDIKIHQGASGEVVVNLDNYSKVTGFQFDILLPDGVTASPGHIKSTNRADGHSLSVAEIIQNKKFRILAFSMTSAAFSGKDGPVVTIPISVANNVLPGSYDIVISGAEVSNAKLQEVLSKITNGILTIVNPTLANAILSSPADRSVDVQLRPQFNWQATPNAETYSLQVSTTADFATLVIKQSELRNLTFNITEDLKANTTYYWRVRAHNSAGSGDWSETWSFTTNSTLTTEGPHLSLSKSVLDFGRVSVTSSAQAKITIYNTGQANLVVTGIGLASTYFSHDLTFPFTIAPGSSREATFTFSGAPAGVHEVQAKLYHSDKNRNPTDVHLKAVAFEPNELSISDIKIHQGASGEVVVNLDNYSKVTGFQFDILLPDGVTASPDNFKLTNRADGHSLSVAEIIQNKKFRILAFSMASAAFSGKDGPVVTIPVSVANDASTGTYDIVISGAEVSNTNLKEVLSNTTDGKLTIVHATLTHATLSSPADRSADVPLRPQFHWQANPNAESYTLQVSTKADFATLVINQTDLHILAFNVAQDLEANTTYYWRVRAHNSAGSGDWSETWSFATNSIVTSISDNTNESFKMYPNPSSGSFRLTLSENFLSGMVQIRQLTGNVVYEKYLSGENKDFLIKPSNLASGTYLVVILENGNVKWVRRWINI